MAKMFNDIQQLQQQLAESNARQQELIRAQKLTTVHELHPLVREIVPTHLHVKPFKAEERKQLLTTKKFKNLPRALKDHNGLALRGIKSEQTKKFINNDLFNMQKRELELATVACALADEFAKDSYSKASAADAIARITKLAYDNAQHMAKLQLETCFKFRGLKGAETMVDYNELDPEDGNIFQQCHIDAIREMDGFRKVVDRPRRTRPNFNGNNRQQQNFQQQQRPRPQQRQNNNPRPQNGNQRNNQQRPNSNGRNNQQNP